jgi:hypothetical protein
VLQEPRGGVWATINNRGFSMPVTPNNYVAKATCLMMLGLLCVALGWILLGPLDLCEGFKVGVDDVRCLELSVVVDELQYLLVLLWHSGPHWAPVDSFAVKFVLC